MLNWEQEKFSNIFKRVSESSNSEAIPIVEYEDIDNESRVLKSDFKYRFSSRDGLKFSEKDILFGKLRPYLRNQILSDFKGKAIGDFWILRSQITHPIFDYYLLDTPRLSHITNLTTGTRMPRSDWNTIDSYNIKVPVDIKETERIARLLSLLDKAISLHKRKLKIIDETIHELREQLFSTKYIAGKKVKSEKMKLNDFLEEVIEHSNKENQYPLLSSTNNGIETRSGRVSGSSNIGYKILRKNQLVLSPQNLWLGNININRDFEVGIVSPSYKVFDIKNIKIIYLENILKTERMKYNFDKISIQGASVVRRNLDMKEFLNLEVRVTQKNEQEKLVKTFVQLRNIKFSLRSKIKILEKLKILYLDKMFI